MSLRILQIMNRVPWPLKDGGAIGYYNYTKGYADNGCEVTVAALNTSKHFVKDIPHELSSVATWHTHSCNTKINPIRALKNLLFGSVSYQMERFYHQPFADMLVKLLNTQTFDVIIFESLFVASYFKCVKPHSKALMVLREHNIEFEIWEKLATGSINPLRRWYMKALSKQIKADETNALQQFDAYTAVTQEDAQMLRKMGCVKPIGVSPAGVCFNQTPPDVSAKAGSIAFLGSLEWLPNQEGVLWFIKNVWPLIKNHPELHVCEIAGRNMPENFTALADDKLRMIGEVPDATLFLQNKQILIVPLFSGSGIRVKIIEGMALGKTIVCTPLARQGIPSASGVHLIEAANAHDFARAIIRCLENESFSKQLGIAAKTFALEHYENKTVTSTVIQFYKEQLNERKI